MGKRLDLKDQKFGKLTALEYDHTKVEKDGTARGVWRCVCECGNETYVVAYDIKSGHINSCGCTYKRRQSDHPNWKGFGEISAHWWQQFIRQPFRRKKKKDINITIEDAWKKFLDQDRLCRFTGMELTWSGRDRAKQTASIDRIDSNGNYDNDNIQYVHKQINIMKNSLSDEEFIRWCCLVADYYRENLNKE